MTGEQREQLSSDLSRARNWIREIRNLDNFHTIMRANDQVKLNDIEKNLEERELFLQQIENNLDN